MQGDALGDPDVGGLNDALLAEMGADEEVHSEEGSLDEASIEDMDDSIQEESEEDAGGPSLRARSRQGSSRQYFHRHSKHLA
jgi:hypothetical protein